jgi:hypothetical protein
MAFRITAESLRLLTDSDLLFTVYIVSPDEVAKDFMVVQHNVGVSLFF